MTDVTGLLCWTSEKGKKRSKYHVKCTWLWDVRIAKVSPAKPEGGRTQVQMTLSCQSRLHTSKSCQGWIAGLDPTTQKAPSAHTWLYQISSKSSSLTKLVPPAEAAVVAVTAIEGGGTMPVRSNSSISVLAACSSLSLAKGSHSRGVIMASNFETAVVLVVTAAFCCAGGITWWTTLLLFSKNGPGSISWKFRFCCCCCC
mmetsp:Transcript_4868/g.13833  ORF Transcript_4868/g.13833 Transcript_4868/m.13833 type:complete len:200 (+) Transcript_4868:168-767(+)